MTTKRGEERGQRGSGRTYRMVMMIPDEGAKIAVHHEHFARYLRQMITDVRGFIVSSRSDVIVVEDERTIRRFQGGGAMIFVDHALTDGSVELTKAQERALPFIFDVARFTNRMFGDE